MESSIASSVRRFLSMYYNDHGRSIAHDIVIAVVSSSSLRSVTLGASSFVQLSLVIPIWFVRGVGAEFLFGSMKALSREFMVVVMIMVMRLYSS